MRLMLGFLILLLSLSASLITQASDNCKQGFSSSWLFDQKAYKISLIAAFPMEVCYYTREEEDPNFEIKYFKDSKVIYSIKIFWQKITQGDVLGKEGELAPVMKKRKDYRVIKFPVEMSLINRYEVLDISTGKLVGFGGINEKSAN